MKKIVETDQNRMVQYKLTKVGNTSCATVSRLKFWQFSVYRNHVITLAEFVCDDWQSSTNKCFALCKIGPFITGWPKF